MKSREFEIPPAPIVIDYVEISKVTETNKISKPTPVVKQEMQEEKDDENPPPLPGKKEVPKKTETNKAQAPSTLPKTKPIQPKKVENAKKEEVDENKLPDKKDKKEDKKQAASDENFSSVLKNLMDDEEPTATSKPGINAPLGDKMTISEQDALRAQLEKCWSVPFGAKGVEDMLVEVEIVVAPDRTVRSAKVVDKGRYSRDTFYRAVADSALRAVRSPMCSPLSLPEDKYDLWKNITVRFNPKDMF